MTQSPVLKMNHIYPLLYLFVLFFDTLVTYGQNGIQPNPGVHKDSSLIDQWAIQCAVKRGFKDISNPETGYADHGNASDVPGKADNQILSLGDGGEVVVSFGRPVRNVKGPDFAIFENSFNGDFLELAFVEVSTDSAHFYRFPAISNTDTNEQTGSFGRTDPSGLRNLAGIHKMYLGTAFDLSELKDSLGDKIDSVRYIRMMDVVGSMDSKYASYDSRGVKINDPWPTPFSSSGFDLDAVALLNPSTVKVGINHSHENDGFRIYPNPAESYIHLQVPGGITIHGIEVYNTSGMLCHQVVNAHGLITKQGHQELNVDGNGYVSFDVSNWNPGMYFLKVSYDRQHTRNFSVYIK